MQLTHPKPSQLTPHPLTVNFDSWADDDPRMLALVADVRARGIDQPLIIDESRRVLDGRHRLRVAKLLDIPTVPCIGRTDAEASDIIRAAIFHRRHYSKSALVWQALPYIAAATGGGKLKRTQNLVTPWYSRNPSTLEFGNTQQQVAAELGVSDELIRQGFAVADLFISRPDIRDEFLPKLLAGEASFWNILSAVAGRDATKGKERPGLAESQLELFDSTWSHLKRGASAWKRFDDSQKEVVMQQFRATAAHLPMELRHALADVLTSFDTPEK